MANQVNIAQPFSYQTETNTHNTRVLSDSGTIDRLRDLDQNIVNQKQISQFTNLVMGVCASTGYKLTTGLFDKLYDYSGNNRDVTNTLTARPTYNATGRFNKASVDFDGTNDTVLSSAFALPATNAFSIACWVYSVPQATAGIFSIPTSSGNYFRVYRLTSTTASLRIQYLSSSTGLNVNLDSPSMFSSVDNTWFHLAITVDCTANQIKWYKNGVLLLTSTAPVTFPADSTSKYWGSIAASQFWNGKLDCMRLYSSVLSLADVQRIMIEI